MTAKSIEALTPSFTEATRQGWLSDIKTAITKEFEMKRLLLAVLLGVVAAVVAPVASASAAEHVECTLKGKATFTTPLGLAPAPGDHYNFTTDGSAANKCNGETASAALEGKGALSCTVSPGLGVAGLAASFEKGTLTAKGKTFTLSRFEFVGAGPVVSFGAEGTSGSETFVGGGAATFVETVKALGECRTSSLGSVEFEATAHGAVH